MQKTLKHIYLLFLALLISLVAGLFYRQLLSDSLINHPGNKRMLLTEQKTARGSILASDFTVLAKSIKEGPFYRRFYPGGSTYAHLTGYFSLTKGAAGLEASQNYWLGANRPLLSFSEWLNAQINGEKKGNDIVLTIRPKLQKLAVSLLAGYKGAIVALEPKTGAVLAMASSPTFDPNQLMQNRLVSPDSSYLVNRATSGLYPPGSVFKIITLAAALESKTVSLNDYYSGPASLSIYGGKVTNFADQEYGRMRVKQAFAKSTNTIFAQIGLKVGTQNLLKQAKAFLLTQPLEFDLPSASGKIGPVSDRLELAWTAVGQGRTLVTPLQIAMVVQAIANKGLLMQPFLVKEVKTPAGLSIKKTSPQALAQPVSRQTAALITEAMISSVNEGTGRAAQIKGVTVAGKTGTAEVGEGLKPHAWFAGFAPTQNPQIVVVVLIENAGLGGQIAAPKAAKLLQAGVPGVRPLLPR